MKARQSLFRAEIAENTDEDDEVDEIGATNEHFCLQSWSVGVAFGRFDIRLATGERSIPPEPEPFYPLPAKSPGMLPGRRRTIHALQWRTR